MAKYTIELRTIVESGINIFDFNYPFYDETKRKEFEEKFIQHFYFHEIGSETIDRFKHYLKDKMYTVFPYYNALFKSATIKYEILDNYKLTETYTRNYQNDGKTSGISSTVGSFQQNQNTDTSQNKNVDTTGNVKDNSTSNTTTENKSITDTESNGNSTTTDIHEKTGNNNSNKTTDELKKYLDTPQGAINLSDTKYLTSLNDDTQKVVETNETTENNNRSSETETTETGKSTTTDNGKSNTEYENNSDTTGNEKTTDNITGSLTDEQKSTTDNNTRNYTHNEHKEEYTLTRKGNIGVDTDSDAIEKHNRLQKTLRNIERMFFEECNDLFMLVY